MAHPRWAPARRAPGLVLAAALALSGCVPAPQPAGAPPAAGLPGYVRSVRPSEVDLWRGVNDRGLTLDVRETAEWTDALGHLDGALQIPYGELEGRLAEIAGWKDRPVLVYCTDGRRSQAAAQFLARSGYHDVAWIDGGIKAYRASFENR